MKGKAFPKYILYYHIKLPSSMLSEYQLNIITVFIALYLMPYDVNLICILKVLNVYLQIPGTKQGLANLFLKVQ